MRKLEGKVAIVTGAGKGIGKGIALAFAKEGAKVVVCEINPQSARSVAEEIERSGKKALAAVCDVGDEGQVKKMVDQAVKEFGPIDILVNNAQGHLPNMPILIPLEELPDEKWDFAFQTGVKATFYCCKAVFPYMKNRGGKIINFASESGMRGQWGMADYNANKEAIRALTRTAAREWGKYKINVNVICPAAETEGQRQNWEGAPGRKEKQLKAIPLGRLGDPEKDLGRVAVFLASEDSDFMTGDTVMVDGGSFTRP